MNKIKIISFLIIIIILIIFSMSLLKPKTGLEIYIIKNEEILKYKPKDVEIYAINEIVPYLKNIKKIKLPKDPLIKDEDIKSYNWKDHEIDLTEEAWGKVKKRIYYKALQYRGNQGLPFMLAINKKPIYIGYFWSSYYSNRNYVPIVFLEILDEKSFKILPLDLSNYEKRYQHIIEDKRIYNYLKKSKKLIE